MSNNFVLYLLAIQNKCIAFIFYLSENLHRLTIFLCLSWSVRPKWIMLVKSWILSSLYWYYYLVIPCNIMDFDFRYDENKHNCFSFIMAFIKRFNSFNSSVCQVETRENFTELYIAPVAIKAVKYIELYRQVIKNGFYIYDKPTKEILWKEHNFMCSIFFFFYAICINSLYVSIKLCWINAVVECIAIRLVRFCCCSLNCFNTNLNNLFVSSST